MCLPQKTDGDPAKLVLDRIFEKARPRSSGGRAFRYERKGREFKSLRGYHRGEDEDGARFVSKTNVAGSTPATPAKIRRSYVQSVEAGRDHRS